MIERIAPDEIVDVWPAARAALMPVLAIARERTAHDVLLDLLSMRAELWHLHDPGDAWLTFRVDKTPCQRIAHMDLCGGRFPFECREEMRAWLIEWAQSHGCTRLTLRGRRGWRRFMPEYREEMILTFDLPEAV